PPTPTLFPYTTLFRSAEEAAAAPHTARGRAARARAPRPPRRLRTAHDGHRGHGRGHGQPDPGHGGHARRPSRARPRPDGTQPERSEEHTSELQSRVDL